MAVRSCVQWSRLNPLAVFPDLELVMEIIDAMCENFSAFFISYHVAWRSLVHNFVDSPSGASYSADEIFWGIPATSISQLALRPNRHMVLCVHLFGRSCGRRDVTRCLIDIGVVHAANATVLKAMHTPHTLSTITVSI